MPRTPSTILSELLVLQAQGGEEQAISRLVELWNPTLKARAYRLTGEQDAAGEVLQESWVGIAKGLSKLRDPSRFGGWAFGILHHTAAVP